MKIITSFDFGQELHDPSEIRVTFRMESSLGEIMYIPEMRTAIADAIVPYLKGLNMSEKSIKEQVNLILYSGRLLERLPTPYYLGEKGYTIKSIEDKDIRYSIQDLLEGRVPDISAGSLRLA